MAVQSATSNFGWQNKFSTTLSSGITASDTTIPLTSLPTPSEGFLVIEPDSSTNWEVIYYTSKTGSAVVCTSVASGRGQDDSTAQSHSSGATVRMDTTAGMFEVLQNMSAMTPGSAGGTAFASGWTLIPSTVFNTVVANGNRSYTCTVNSTDLTSYISAGMRVRTTRTVAAPTQCTSLNGTTQYYSKSSPAGMTFTDDFVVSAWVKMTQYGAFSKIASRYNGTSGWEFGVNSGGQVYLEGFNAGAGNNSFVQSYQSIPLNKWVHVAAQLDMSTYTATTTTSYVMIDGVDVPASVTRQGTNPTALIQAGNLEIGSANAANFFPGKIAQVAIFSAKVTQATIQGYISQGLSGSETSLISAYSFNNAITDLNTTNANNLTANGSAVATSADSPFGAQADGTVSSTLDYGIITKISYSTNTTVVVQVPEGCTIPTTGGVSALSYSIQKAPYGMPVGKNKWQIRVGMSNQTVVSSPTTNIWYGYNASGNSTTITVPIGDWVYGYETTPYATRASASTVSAFVTLSTANNTESDIEMTGRVYAVSVTEILSTVKREKPLSLSSSQVYYLNYKTDTSSITNIQSSPSVFSTIYADCAYL